MAAQAPVRLPLAQLIWPHVDRRCIRGDTLGSALGKHGHKPFFGETLGDQRGSALQGAQR
jgi:hypothetical protein